MIDEQNRIHPDDERLLCGDAPPNSAAGTVIIFAALFAASRFRGSEDHSGKPSASYDVHTRQLT